MKRFGIVLVMASWACGGSEAKPAETAEAPPASIAHSDGGAVEGDLYAQFDGGALEQQADEHAAQNGPTTGGGGDVGPECQGAAAAWEKRARPEVKACYREGKKKDPNLMGTAHIVVDVGSDGKAKPAKLDGTSSLGDDVANCMVKAVAKTAFPEAGACRGRQLTLPIEFPTPVKPK